MNDFNPFPRPVELALPPNATVIADKTALFPPTKKRQLREFSGRNALSYFRYVLAGL